MANDGTIKKDQVIDPEVKKGLDEATQSLKELLDQYTAFIGVLKTSAKTLGDEVKTIDDLNRVQTENKKLIDEIDQKNRKLKDAEAKVNEETAKAILNRKELAEKTKNEAILNDKLAGTEEKLRAQNKLLLQERKKLIETDKDYEKNLKRINDQIDINNKKLKETSSVLEKQKGTVGDYNSIWESTKGKFVVISSVIEVAKGAIGGLSKVLEFGKSVIESTKHSNDSFEASIQAMSAAWDVFKKAIATFDFHNLLQNMRDAAEAGKKYGEAMADLGDQLRSYKVQESAARGETDLLKASLMDQNLTAEERLKIGEKLKTSETNLFNLRKQILTEISDVELEKLSKRIGLDKEVLKNLIERYNADRSIREEAVKYGQALKVVAEAQKTTESKTSEAFRNILSGNLVGAVAQLNIPKETIENARTLIKETKQDVKDYYDAIYKYGKSTDGQLDVVANAMMAVTNASSELASETNRTNRQINSLTKEIKDNAKKLGDDIAKELEEDAAFQEKLAEEERNRIKKDQQENLNIIEYYGKQDENRLAQQYINKEITAEEYSEKLLQIQIETLKQELQYAEDNGIETLALKQKLFDAEIALGKRKLDKEQREGDEREKLEEEIEKNIAANELRIAEEKAQKKREITEASISLLADIGGTVSGIQNNLFEKQLSDADKQRDEELARAGDNAKKKEEIEKDYNRKVAQIRLKQAKADRTNALFEIAISTAMNIAKSVLTPWLIPFIVATSALQTALVLSKPLPEVPSFKKGTQDAPGGYSILHGGEIVTLPSGKSFFTKGGINDPIPMVIPKHTKVTPNAIVKDQLKNMDINSESGSMQNAILSEINRNIAKEKPVLHVDINETGFNIYNHSSRGRVNYINNRFRGHV